MAAEVLRLQAAPTVPSVPVQTYTFLPSFPPREHHKKVYYCQRCLNHDTPRPRKNHKCECPYADCNCEKCGLVEKRRILNLQLQIYNAEGDFEKKSDDDEDRKHKGERVPNCQKCGQHGRKSRLKGHKRNCPFRECACAKCAVVTERQKLMADQIKIRRRQRKDTILNITREHITSTINAAAALSSAPFNLNLNALLYSSIKTNPQTLMASPASSDSSSYSPSHPFSPSLSLLLPSSADHSPTSQTPSIPIIPTSAAPIVAPVPLNPANFSFLPAQSQAQDAAALFQAILDHYRMVEETGTNNSTSSSPSKDDESGDEESEGLNSNCIIDVCTV